MALLEGLEFKSFTKGIIIMAFGPRHCAKNAASGALLEGYLCDIFTVLLGTCGGPQDDRSLSTAVRHTDTHTQHTHNTIQHTESKPTAATVNNDRHSAMALPNQHNNPTKNRLIAAQVRCR